MINSEHDKYAKVCEAVHSSRHILEGVSPLKIAELSGIPLEFVMDAYKNIFQCETTPFIETEHTKGEGMYSDFIYENPQHVFDKKVLKQMMNLVEENGWKYNPYRFKYEKS